MRSAVRSVLVTLSAAGIGLLPARALCGEPRSFWGGSDQDRIYSMALDGSGRIVLVGTSRSADFPAVRPIHVGPPRGVSDVAIAVLEADGTGIVFSTLLGGTNMFIDQEFGFGVAVDGDGMIYVAGETSAPDFPTTPGAFQAVHAGRQDAFVVKIDPDAGRLVYSTFLGGPGDDRAVGIAIDGAGRAYVAGHCDAGFPATAGTFQDTFPGGNAAAFVARLSADGSQLERGTFLGGTAVSAFQHTAGYGLAITADGDLVLVGDTRSPDLPLVNPVQASHRGGGDAFVARFSAELDVLEQSTYLGGSGWELGGYHPSVDALGRVTLGRFTRSADLPLANPLQATLGGTQDGWVARLSANGSVLEAATYLGGSGRDQCLAARAAADGSTIVVGDTGSADFPQVRPLQGFGGVSDAFVSRLDPAGASLTLSTFLGGSDADVASDAVFDAKGNLWVAGSTASPDFPVADALQPVYGGLEDGFFARVCMHEVAVRGATATPASLWPPDHKMVDVSLDYEALNPCHETDGMACTLDVASDEPADGMGDGRTEPDFEVIDSRHLRLRAERSGRGDGRVYTVTIRCAYERGGAGETRVEIPVAHDRRSR